MRLFIDITSCKIDSSLCFIQPGIWMMYSAYKLNKQGDNIQPWCTPFPILNQSIVPCVVLLFLDLHTGFSRGRSGGLVFPSLSEFSTVCRDPCKGFRVVKGAEVDVFWNSLAFSMIQQMLAIWSLVPLPFLKPARTYGSSRFTYCWSLAWRILSITLLACEKSAIVR